MTALSFDIRWQGASGFQLACAADLPLAGVTAVYGPSGSGKTSLLECLAGLRTPMAGSRISFHDQPWLEGEFNLPAWERDVSVVFQDGRLFGHLNVSNNLQYALQRCRGEARFALRDVVERLELSGLTELFPEQLSAGQRQRVAIARALVNSPRLLLLDEPLANLDQASRRQCLACLNDVADTFGLPMIYVSHDIEEISQLADRLLMLENGARVEYGPLIELASRLDTRLSHEPAAAAIVEGKVQQHDTRYGLTELSVAGQILRVNQLSAAPGKTRRLRIPARDVSIARSRHQDSSILNSFETRLTEIENTDDSRMLLRLALGEQYLLARITRRSADQLALTVGDTLYAQVKSAALLNDPMEGE